MDTRLSTRASSVLPSVLGMSENVHETPSYTIKQGRGRRVSAQEERARVCGGAAQPQGRQHSILRAAKLQMGHRTRKDHVQGTYYQASKEQ